MRTAAAKGIITSNQILLFVFML